VSEYILGINDREFARLELQHGVWASATDDFLDACEIPRGSRVLDVGCGPGFASEDLLRRVGSDGEVVALDEAPRWIAHLDARVAAGELPGLSTRCASLDEAELEDGTFDVVFARWLLAFLPDPGAMVARLARLLAPGGVLAVMDYNHEGISIFPPSRGFDAAVRAVRELYASRGGSAWVMGEINRHLRAAGLEPRVLRPYVQIGGPDSPAFRWVDAFFPDHVQGLVDAGVMQPAERDLFRDEWEQRKNDPDMLFFSPYIVGAAGRLLPPPTRG
jgi:SAM-dependent methyltransferase